MIDEPGRSIRSVRLSAPQPPPPDTSHIPRYVNLTVLECLYSEGSRYRAVLVRDSSAYLRVRYEKWDLSEWEDNSFGFWGPVGQGTTITDTIDNARLLARERLLEFGVLDAK